MNIKIAKTLLCLCCLYLVGFYILKFIFPEVLLEQVVSPNVLKLGILIESSTTLTHIYKFLTSFITFYLFICASKGSFVLNNRYFLYLICSVIICRCCSEFFPSFYTHTSISIMFLLALICKGKFLYSTISFVVHGYLSQLLFSIRGFETIINKYNIASSLMFMIEGYVWLILLSLIFYMEDLKHGCTTTLPK